MKQPRHAVIPMLILTAFFALAVLLPVTPIPRTYFAMACFGIGLAASLLVFFLLIAYEKRQRLRMTEVFAKNDKAAGELVREVSVPCALIDEAGRIVWENKAMRALYGGRDIHEVVPNYNAKSPLAAFPIEYASGAFLVKTMPVVRRGEERLTFMYWVDSTEAAHYKRLYEEQMPYVALIYVDNFTELTSDHQFHRTTALAEVERLIAGFSESVHGIYRRYDSGRFLVVFEAKQLEQVEKDRFSLLEAAHHIATGTGATVSLSIAVGVADRLVSSNESARQAMELALGRGGDQAVVKHGTEYRFFGGKMQHDAMQSRVRAREIAKGMRQLLEGSGDVFIMGHRNADMDCIGAALGILTCARKLGLRAYLVLEASNTMIDGMVQQLRHTPAYVDVIVTPEQAENRLRPNSTLVVVDTQRPSTTAAPELILMAKNVLVIDHHRRSTEYIENTSLQYLESRASSTSELVTELIQYFDDDLRPSAFVCTALLAGIIVDTKNFFFNVGARTFEAAGYLRRNGADIGAVKAMFKSDLTEYNECADTIKTAEILPGGIAVATVPDNVDDAKLIAAKSADALLNIRDVEAAFVLGLEDGEISVSGRSLGRVNVQLICEKLGGGGHLMMAGAQLSVRELGEARTLVKRSIQEYMKEAD